VNDIDQTEAKARATAIKAQKAEIDRLVHKRNTLYDDRLDGRITGTYYDQKAAQIESQQAELRRNIAELESCPLPPLTTAVELARLTSQACAAFRQQTGEEQRKLITLVMKEASWQEKKLSATLFEPFSLVRRANKVKARNFNDLEARKESLENWLPELTRALTFSRQSEFYFQQLAVSDLRPATVRSLPREFVALRLTPTPQLVIMAIRTNLAM